MVREPRSPCRHGIGVKRLACLLGLCVAAILANLAAGGPAWAQSGDPAGITRAEAEAMQPSELAARLMPGIVTSSAIISTRMWFGGPYIASLTRVRFYGTPTLVAPGVCGLVDYGVTLEPVDERHRVDTFPEPSSPMVTQDLPMQVRGFTTYQGLGVLSDDVAHCAGERSTIGFFDVARAKMAQALTILATLQEAQSAASGPNALPFEIECKDFAKNIQPLPAGATDNCWDGGRQAVARLPLSGIYHLDLGDPEGVLLEIRDGGITKWDVSLFLDGDRLSAIRMQRESVVFH